MRIIDTKENDAGIMTTLESDTHTRYEITTFAWKWRWWKIYYASKIIQILEWTCILTWQPDWFDDEITLNPSDWEFHIPEWIPHVFYFPELTKMIETFTRNTRIQDFEKYRAIKK